MRWLYVQAIVDNEGVRGQDGPGAIRFKHAVVHAADEAGAYAAGGRWSDREAEAGRDTYRPAAETRNDYVVDLGRPALQAAKSTVLEQIADGVLPASVASLEEAARFVDAGDYAALIWTDAADEANAAECSELLASLDAWMRAGMPDA